MYIKQIKLILMTCLSILHAVFLHCHVNRESSALHRSVGARLLGFPDGIVT